MVGKRLTIFFRKRNRLYLTPFIILSVIYVFYQLIIFIQLSKEIKKAPPSNLVLGTNEFQSSYYNRDENNHFTCIFSMEKINFSQVNDDYCDCSDGSDEPGTNACPNGQFYCTQQVPYKQFPKLIHSSKVNDGICDCCDGSDEWKHKTLNFHLDKILQEKLEKYQSPCPNLCPT